MKDEFQKYVDQCKAYEKNPEKYTLYLNGHFFVGLDKYMDMQRQQGKLKKGTFIIN